MKLIRTPAELENGSRKVCLAIGVFDGVHLGHQQVIRQTVDDARKHEALSVVVTFDRHPALVLAPGSAPAAIYSLAQQERAIGSLGVDALLLIPFDEEFSRRAPDRFIQDLASGFGRIHSLCVGAEFVFGHRRTGNVTLLRELGRALGFTVHGLSAVSLDGEMVSSTRIRETVRRGQLEAAGEMLGRAYALAGPVMRGDGLGRQLGFPTANVDIGGRLAPPNGVYAVHAWVRSRLHQAVVNIGLRPTLNQPAPQLRVEAHLLEPAGDLYGSEMELFFVQKLRDEQRFPDLPSLQAQIARDIDAARACF